MIIELVEVVFGDWLDKDNVWWKVCLVDSMGMFDKIDSVDFVLGEKVVDADDVESRLVDAKSVDGCLVVPVIIELVEVVFGDWLDKDVVWWKVCLVDSIVVFDEIDSVDFVLDDIVVDAADVESRLVDAKSVDGSLVVPVIIELVEVVFGDWLDKDDVWWKVCLVDSIVVFDEIDSVDFVLDDIVVDAADVESRLVDAKSVDGCLVVPVIIELVEVVFGDWLDKSDVWWKVCLVVSIVMFDEIDSVDFVLDEKVVDADNVESRLVDAKSVDGCLVVPVTMELVEVVFGDWLDKDDVWWKVCLVDSMGMFDKIDSVDFVLDEKGVDADDVESGLVDAKCVDGCLVVPVIIELVEVVFGDWLDKDDVWWKVCLVDSIVVFDEIDSVDFVLDDIVVDAADVESRLVDAKSVDGCLVVPVIIELVEVVFGDWLDKSDVWWKVCLVVSIVIFDEIDSVDFVLDEKVVDADNVESRLVDAKSVDGCLVVPVIMELVEVVFGDWLDKDDV